MHTTALTAGAICPFCGQRYDAASALDGDAIPGNGDLTLCMNCGEWAMFDSGVPGGLRKPTDSEYEVIVANPITGKARKIWQQMKEERRAKAKAPKLSIDQKYDALTNPDLTLDKQFDLACEFAFTNPPPDQARPLLKRMFLLGALVLTNRMMTSARQPDPRRAAREVARLLAEIEEQTIGVLGKAKP
ncbi:hypothetical protein I6F26_10445 [Ensifer sp. IC3342]|nr:hypothetical protein [Ensifer sp. BRP08]MCA1446998.1 hypothetical protein [Ensifer sp. IC3342]